MACFGGNRDSINAAGVVFCVQKLSGEKKAWYTECNSAEAVRDKIRSQNRVHSLCKTILTLEIPSCKSNLIDNRGAMWQDVPERRAANMEIGKKLKDARMKSGFTQETVAEKINVSRQTISNWENEKSYPDIISVIALSDLYSTSLDDLLKGDREMMEHLEECKNVVKSTQKLIGAIILNAVTVILLITLSMLLPDKSYYLLVVFCLAIMSSSVLLYQIIKRI